MSCVFQLLIVAWDSGNPEQEISTTLVMTVKRNEHAPRFFPDRYVDTVSEHDPVGTNITTVSATDSDLPVSTAWQYSSLGGTMY